jgi:hypothetical protein
MGILKDGKDKGFILKNKLDLQRPAKPANVHFGWKPAIYRDCLKFFDSTGYSVFI